MSTLAVDLCADIGEGFGVYGLGDDEALLRTISSANIACGFHAGDPLVMHRTVATCVDRGVAIGAHPGFPDRAGFGRRLMELTHEQVLTDVLYQLGALSAFAAAAGARLAHVTPHGRLGNLVVTDPGYAEPVAQAVVGFDATLVVLTQPGELARSTLARGGRVGLLGLPDRGYEDDGTLVSRRRPGALIEDPDAVAERAVAMVVEHRVRAASGAELAIEADSILLHGDSPAAVEIARRVRTALEGAGVEIRPIDGPPAVRAEG